MKILVPIDGSEPSNRALDVAIDMATAMDATLDVVHVTDQETDATDQIISAAREKVDTAGVTSSVELLFDGDADAVGASGTVGEDILSLIEERTVDHIVIGSTGGGRIQSMFVGSASKTVLDGADIPVTVVP